jgi:hypothetical protein
MIEVINNFHLKVTFLSRRSQTLYLWPQVEQSGTWGTCNQQLRKAIAVGGEAGNISSSKLTFDKNRPLNYFNH